MRRHTTIALLTINIFGICFASKAGEFATDPDEAIILYDDIALFWQAYDRALKSPDPAWVFQKEYIERGGQGIQAMARLGRVGDGTSLYNAVVEHRRYLESVRPILENIRQREPDIRKALRKAKSVYPDMQFAPVYLMIGEFRAAGTNDDNGLYIGAEFFARHATVSIASVPKELQQFLHSPDFLEAIIVHELAHHFQARPQSYNLLNQSIIEGMADYLAIEATGKNFNSSVYHFGYRHEQALWPLFAQEMHMGFDSQAVFKWFYSPPVGWPRDLGYFLGYRIVESYISQAKDKPAAIRHVFTTLDYKGLLTASGYGRFPSD